jgi:hypothetical protein
VPVRDHGGDDAVPDVKEGHGPQNSLHARLLPDGYLSHPWLRAACRTSAIGLVVEADVVVLHLDPPAGYGQEDGEEDERGEDEDHFVPAPLVREQHAGSNGDEPHSIAT